jgi:hypothetical protein
LGAADRDERHFCQAIDDQRRIMRRRDGEIADGHVDPVGDEVRIGQGRRNARIDVRVGAGEAVEARRQPFRGQSRRRADHQHAVLGETAQPGEGVPDMREAGLQARIEQLAGVGERNRAHPALEQF